MGFRPPSARRSSSASTTTNTNSAPRAVRPIPERTAPHRTPEQLFRTEEPTPPIADAVSKAYQVFDRYLKEGQEYAAGQSAWYTGQGVPAMPGMPALPAMPAGMPSADVLSAAMWLFEQMRGMGQNMPGMPDLSKLPDLSKVPAQAAQAAARAANWPEPRWGGTNPVLQAKPPPTKWDEERFDDDAPAKSAAPSAVNRAYAWNNKRGT